ncbi:MAG: PadR family transcriptional regulator [Pseudomonadota bacterium]|nr:PadR family transcriptional regulator [Pseudomonadota bacterium]
MRRSRALSPAARRVLAALARAGSAGRHGYDLCVDAEIKSGTLYPLLIRLETQGYLAAEWRAPETPGTPPRHVYQLTAQGRRLAAENPVASGAGDALPEGLPA